MRRVPAGLHLKYHVHKARVAQVGKPRTRTTHIRPLQQTKQPFRRKKIRRSLWRKATWGVRNAAQQLALPVIDG